jgi:hypothetical protein
MPMVLHRNAITRPRCEISGPPLLSFEQVHSAPVNSDPCIHPSQSQSHAHVQSAFRRTPSILTQNTSSSRQAAARHLPDPARAMNEARAHPESHRMSRKAQQRDRGTHESDTVLPFSIPIRFRSQLLSHLACVRPHAARPRRRHPYPGKSFAHNATPGRGRAHQRSAIRGIDGWVVATGHWPGAQAWGAEGREGPVSRAHGRARALGGWAIWF